MFTHKISGEFNGLHLTIEPTEQASQRTKNRIRERGPTFRLLSVVERTLTHNEKVALFNSTDDLWLGWLPVREFNITEVKDPNDKTA